MTERTFDVKLGDRRYRLAGDALSRELFGVPAFRRYWREPDTDISGPGETNPRERRWVITDWAGGEGQIVHNPDDPLAAVRYDRSNAVDLSTPSEIKLGRLFTQTAISGTSGAGTTWVTTEASTFTQSVAPTANSGTDKFLQGFGAAAYTEATYSAGQYEVEFHAYSESAGTIGATATVEGNDAMWNTIKGNTTIQGTNLLMQPASDPTCVIQTDAFDPPEHNYRVVCHVKGNKDAGGPAKAVVEFELRDAGTGNVVTKNQKQLKSEDGDYANFRQFAISFSTQAGRTYRYRITVLSQDGTGKGVIFDKIVASIAASGGEQGEVYLGVNNMTAGGTELATHRADVQNDTATTLVARLNFTVVGASQTIRFTFTRGIASMNIVADKIRRTSTATPFKDVDNLHFGQGSEIWAADFDTANPVSIAKYDSVVGGLVAVGDLASGNGDRVIQMANSDNNEYVITVAGTVWKLTPPTTVVQYTAAYTSPVGVAVAGDRLYVLTESDAAGVRLWEQPLDTSAGLPLAIGTAIYNPITAGTPADQSTPRRMASTPTGPVFFVNRAAECTVYAWNSVSASPTVVASVSGFRARAIAHSAGLTFIAGENPVTEGGTKAAMFVLDNVTGPAAPEFLNLPFEREGDPDSYIQDLQVFGPNVFALAHVMTTPPTMRLWRVSLADPGGLFQEADVPLATGELTRALAITASTRAIAGDKGGPYIATTNYVTGQIVYLRTSLNAFGLLDDKRLKGLSVTGLFPTGTSVNIRYSLDNGANFLEAGQWTADETKTIPTADLDPLFKNLQLEIVPAGTATATPTVYQVEAIAELTRGTGPPGSVGGREQVFQMVLDCRNESATSHISSQQATGYIAYNYIWSLLALQTVAMEERYYTPWGAGYIVELDKLDEHFMGPGEGLVLLEAVER